MSHPVRLGVNVDHIATLRQARGTEEPDPIAAAAIAELAGADGITIHLRGDRRHIPVARAKSPKMNPTPAAFTSREDCRTTILFARFGSVICQRHLPVLVLRPLPD